MSDQVAVMNKGKFEQVDTPQNLYSTPNTPFVAQFVGENNTWAGKVTGCEGNMADIKTSIGNAFRTIVKTPLSPGSQVDLFLRPESMLIQPDETIEGLNRFEVIVKDILFDGANSRILANPLNGDIELLIALPQTRQYGNIRPNDRLLIGWHPQSGICFERN